MDLNAGALRANLSKLPENDRAFASSLLQSIERRGGDATPKQAYWVEELTKRASAEQPAARKTEAVGDLAGVIALFDKARKHLKHPAVVLGYGSDHALRLNVAGPDARVPGSINVVDDESRTWFGRILLDGVFQHSPRDTPPTGLSAVLAEFAQDPAGVATRHGRLTGRCCFCNTALTDERSTAVGYGKTCAGNYGLPWGN